MTPKIKISAQILTLWEVHFWPFWVKKPVFWNFQKLFWSFLGLILGLFSTLKRRQSGVFSHLSFGVPRKPYSIEIRKDFDLFSNFTTPTTHPKKSFIVWWWWVVVGGGAYLPRKMFRCIKFVSLKYFLNTFSYQGERFFFLDPTRQY